MEACVDPTEFREWLRQQALAEGFAKAGFASCEPFETERERLGAWFREGRGDLLPYLQPELLLEPRVLFPEARTALLGFFPYANPEAVPGGDPGSLKVSRYLWGTDYHR